MKMRTFIVLCIIILISISPDTSTADTADADLDRESNGTTHNWVEYSTSFETIEVGTHEYSYWKNFIRHTRTCHISHVIKTVVYYCDEHDHTKVETELVETIHSGNHS